MGYPRPLKLHGINMTIEEWFKLLIPTVKVFATEEVRQGRLNRAAYRSVNSLSDAINSINWDTSVKGRAYWEGISRKLDQGDVSIVNTKNIMQIMH